MTTKSHTELAALAKSCGATVYVHRTNPHEPAIAFSPAAWEKFAAALESPERVQVAQDSARLDWLESNYGLHREAEITYVVDGFQIEFTYDGNTTDGKCYHGEDLRAAIDAARARGDGGAG